MDKPQFPGFEIIETMPRGGMSTVYKARQISLDRIVALKTLPLTLAAESADINQFLAEARITANLKHPNIVQVYDFGKTETGAYYFVMEFVSGYSVGDWIRRKQFLSEENALLIAQSVADALGYAWQTARVVHCDIKPDNIIIDGDGSVKVADLGLAKSVRSVVDRAKLSTGMVFGTPNYISPEQSRGDGDLDCRADIYSLGATLYHCLTGKMPFEGAPALAAMDLQITDRIPDVQDVNHRVSTEAAFLIEKMLAKDREYRPADWKGVLADISRVKHCQMPAGELLPADVSTMRRSAQRGSRPRTDAAVTTQISVKAGAQASDSTAFRNMERQFSRKQKRKGGLQAEWWFAGAITLAVLILGIFVAHSVMKGNRAAVVADTSAADAAASALASQEVAQAQEAEASAREDLVSQLFEFARKWTQANPALIDDAIRKYEKVANDTNDTKYSRMALVEIKKLREQKRKAVAGVMDALNARANSLIATNELAQAIDLYEQYQGEWAPETAAIRGAKIRELRARVRVLKENEQQAVEEATHQWRQLVDGVCVSLVAGDVAGALAQATQAGEAPALASRKKETAGLVSLLTEASRLDRRILDAFQALKDKEVTVILSGGAEKVTIRNIQGDTIQAEQTIVVGAGQVTRPKSFRVADLALAEKRLRLGSEDKPDMALMQGLLSVRDRDWPSAESYFAKTGPVLSAALLAKLGTSKATQSEEQARRDLTAILHNAQIDVVQPDAGCEEYLAAIRKMEFTAREAQLLAQAVGNYRATFDRTQFAQQYAPVLEALAHAPVTQPPEREAAPQPSARTPALTLPQGKPSVQPLASAQPPLPTATPEAVKAQLLERNPDMESETIVFLTDESGKIDRVEIVSPDVKDIRPLAVLSDVCAILCAGSSPQGGASHAIAPLADLSPLRGLPLRELDVSHTMVKDLAPLMGMSLSNLNLQHTKVTEIACLKGLLLTNLNLRETRVRDIGVLRGMPLQRLNLSETDVTDIAPLKGLPLEMLSLARTQVRDLTPLNGTSLTALDIGDTVIKDSAVLKNLPLLDLSMARAKVTDFTFLASLKPARLNLAGTDFRDFSLLKDMPLKSLNIGGTKVKDRDLALLQGLPLQQLNLSNTEIKDLDPLKNMASLRSLNIMQTQVKDLTPIQNLPIESLWLDYNMWQPEKHWFRAILRRMPNLRQVNGMAWAGSGEGDGRRRR